ncbi:MAG TPA: hypothetical protein VF715_06635 [Thermoleophilaceae bacterium]
MTVPDELIIPIVGDAAIAGPVADGRLVPVLILDTAARPEVTEMVRVHEHLPPGDVLSQWGSALNDDDAVTLLLEFQRPVAVDVTLVFSIERQAVLVESILNAGALYLQPGKPGDRFRDKLDEARILIEVPSTGFEPHWERLLHKRMVKVMAGRLGISRRKARPAAERHIAEIRSLTRLRFGAPVA